MDHLLASCDASIVLTQAPLRETIEWPGHVEAVLSDYPDPGGPLAPLDPVQQPDDLAYVIFTSGSSACRKG